MPNASQPKLQHRTTLFPSIVTAVYLFVGLICIWIPESVWRKVFQHPDALANFHRAKWMLFILLSAWLLYAMTRKYQQYIARSEEALREAHEALQTLVQASPVAIVAIDPEGKVSSWNPAAERIFGWCEAEVLGQPNPIVPAVEWHSFEGLLSRVLSGEMLTGLELKRRTQSGATIDVSLSTAPRHDRDGGICGIVSVIADITDKKQAERALRANERFLTEIFAGIQDGLCVLDPDFNLVQVNPAMERWYEHRMPLVGRKCYAAFHGRTTVCENCPARTALQTGRASSAIIPKELPEDECGWTEVFSFPMLDNETGQRSGVVQYVRDITTRVNAERALEVREQELRQIIDLVPQFIFAKNVEGEFILANSAVAGVYGTTVEAMLGKTDADLTGVENEVEHFRGDDLEVIETQQAKYVPEETITDSRGRTRVLETVKIPFRRMGSDLPAVLGVSTDITERKLAEERQRKMADGQRAVLQMADELLACSTMDDLLRRAVELPRRMLGVDRCGLFLLSEDGTHIRGTYGTNLQGETTDEHAVTIPVSPDGGRETLQDRGNARWFTFEQPQVEYVDGALREVGRGTVGATPVFSLERRLGTFYNDNARTGADLDPIVQENLALYCSLLGNILERRQAEDAMFAEKERLAVTLRSIGDGVITTDRGGRVVLINKVTEMLTGWTQEEAYGKPLAVVFNIINERTRERCENPVEKVLESGGVVGLANHTALIARDGTERVIADSGAPIFDRESHIIGVVLVFRDVTEKERVDEELRKADKLESVGVLAGGIAHDFNNILTAIIGNLSLAKMQADADSPGYRHLAEAERASLRARDLTRQLLTFARGGAPVRKMASLAEVIRDSAVFAMVGTNATCEFRIDENLWPAEVDEGQVSQVISNLVINAHQAMPNGGQIVVSAGNATLPADNPLHLHPGHYLTIAIADQGTGIPSAHLPKIFDPFFTTKERGTGLGLASTYSIVSKHDGAIRVDSKLGQGTTFTIYLPATPAAQVSSVATVAMPTGLKGNILVMDDEAIIREVVTTMLSSLGYAATAVSNGEEAVRAYEHALQVGERYHAVIMDLTIPGGMGGRETIARLLEVDPQVKGIVSSGYSTDPIMSNYRKYGFKGVIAKPYRLGDLAEVLHRATAADGETGEAAPPVEQGIDA